jgi:hypothetical protein
MAAMSMSFDDWKGGRVALAVVEVPAEDAQRKKDRTSR